MLLNTEKRIHVRPRETKVETRRKSKTLSLWTMREPKSAPPFLYRSAREERRPRGRLLAPWAEGRGPDEENEEDERPERGTDRSARERNPRLPWLPSHSRLASLPWRRRHPLVHLVLLSPLFPLSRFLCSARTTSRLARTREIPSSSLSRRQSSLRRRRAARSLALAPSFLRGGYRREGSRKREKRTGETARGRVRMRDTWSSAISRLDDDFPEQFDHLSNANH